MRAREFLSLSEDINNVLDYTNLIYLAEAETNNKTVNENDIRYLDGIQSDMPEVGRSYRVALVICLPESRIMLHGSKEPIKLVNIFDEDSMTVYEFENKRRFPERRVSNTSYAKTFLYQDKDGLDFCLSALVLKFKTTTNISEAAE
jgi:hypothetical protein